VYSDEYDSRNGHDDEEHRMLGDKGGKGAKADDRYLEEEHRMLGDKGGKGAKADDRYLEEEHPMLGDKGGKGGKGGYGRDLEEEHRMWVAKEERVEKADMVDTSRKKRDTWLAQAKNNSTTKDFLPNQLR
jgi:hypothetical protein